MDQLIIDAIKNKLPNYKNNDDQYNLNLVWGYCLGVLKSQKLSEAEIAEKKKQFDNDKVTILTSIKEAREEEARTYRTSGLL